MIDEAVVDPRITQLLAVAIVGVEQHAGHAGIIVAAVQKLEVDGLADLQFGYFSGEFSDGDGRHIGIHHIEEGTGHNLLTAVIGKHEHADCIVTGHVGNEAVVADEAVVYPRIAQLLAVSVIGVEQHLAYVGSVGAGVNQFKVDLLANLQFCYVSGELCDGDRISGRRVGIDYIEEGAGHNLPLAIGGLHEHADGIAAGHVGDESVVIQEAFVHPRIAQLFAQTVVGVELHEDYIAVSVAVVAQSKVDLLANVQAGNVGAELLQNDGCGGGSHCQRGAVGLQHIAIGHLDIAADNVGACSGGSKAVAGVHAAGLGNDLAVSIVYIELISRYLAFAAGVGLCGYGFANQAGGLIQRYTVQLKGGNRRNGATFFNPDALVPVVSLAAVVDDGQLILVHAGLCGRERVAALIQAGPFSDYAYIPVRIGVRMLLVEGDAMLGANDGAAAFKDRSEGNRLANRNFIAGIGCDVGNVNAVVDYGEAIPCGPGDASGIRKNDFNIVAAGFGGSKGVRGFGGILGVDQHFAIITVCIADKLIHIVNHFGDAGASDIGRHGYGFARLVNTLVKIQLVNISLIAVYIDRDAIHPFATGVSGYIQFKTVAAGLVGNKRVDTADKIVPLINDIPFVRIVARIVVQDIVGIGSSAIAGKLGRNRYCFANSRVTGDFQISKNQTAVKYVHISIFAEGVALIVGYFNAAADFTGHSSGPGEAVYIAVKGADFVTVAGVEKVVGCLCSSSFALQHRGKGYGFTNVHEAAGSI